MLFFYIVSASSFRVQLATPIKASQPNTDINVVSTLDGNVDIVSNNNPVPDWENEVDNPAAGSINDEKKNQIHKKEESLFGVFLASHLAKEPAAASISVYVITTC